MDVHGPHNRYGARGRLGDHPGRQRHHAAHDWRRYGPIIGIRNGVCVATEAQQKAGLSFRPVVYLNKALSAAATAAACSSFAL